MKSIVNDHGIDTCGSELVGPWNAQNLQMVYPDPDNASEEELVAHAIEGWG